MAFHLIKKREIFFYVNEGNVVFRSLFFVVGMDQEITDVPVLFQTTDLGQIMFTGNYTEYGHILHST
jgi:hypothetical protein